MKITSIMSRMGGGAAAIVVVLAIAASTSDSSDGAGEPRAQSSASLGTLACTDRSNRLTLVRGDGRKRRTLKIKVQTPTFSPDGSRIAFEPMYPRNPKKVAPKLLVSDRNGRNVRTLVSYPPSKVVPPSGFFQPSWSSDSAKLAYIRDVVVPRPVDPDDPGPYEEDPNDPYIVPRLFIADASGGGEHAVPLHRPGVPSSSDPALWTLDQVTAFSPDGQTLAISGVSVLDHTSGQFTRGIWLVDASSGAASLLLELSHDYGANIFALAWSPDGTRLAVYDSASVGPRSIRGFFVLDVGTATATRADPLIGEAWLRWSPDSRRIATSGVANAGRQAKFDSRVADADMNGVIDPSRRTPKRFEEGNQIWSPDGRRIAFNRTYEGTGSRYGTYTAYRKAAALSGVYVVPAGGGKPKKLIASSPPSPATWVATGLLHPNEIICTDWSE